MICAGTDPVADAAADALRETSLDAGNPVRIIKDTNLTLYWDSKESLCRLPLQALRNSYYTILTES
jgi:hypothetical protein